MKKLLELRAQKKALAKLAQDAHARAASLEGELHANALAECDDALAKIEGIDAEIKALETQEAENKKAEQDRAKKLASFRASIPSRVLQADAGETIQRATNITTLADRDPMNGFRSPREFINSVMNVAMGISDDRLNPLRAAAGSDEQGGHDNSAGAFMLPQAMMPDLMSVQGEGDPTAGRTTLIPMEAPSVKINARTDKNHSNSVTGGFRFFRRAETQDATSSKVEIEQIVLNANSLTGLAYATEELLSDSPASFAAIIANGFRDELPNKLIEEKLRGTGAGQMLGVLNSGNPALITVAAEGGQAADTIVGANVVKMRARSWGYGRAVWMANIDTFPQISKLHLAGTNSDFPLFIPGNGTTTPDTLLGRPIFFSEYLETLGDIGDLLLADWSQYLEGQLGGVESAESIHVRFLANERAFRINLRNDGRPWWRSALTPRKGTNTLSPFVTLAAR
jgi:HK97 family phage major capsid protein